MESETIKFPSTQGKDVLLVHSETDDGRGYKVLRKRGDTVEAGSMHPLEEGKAIHGEIVRLTPRTESPALFNVEPLVGETAKTHGAGPAKVTTAEYRKGWDSVWATKPAPRELN